MKKLKIVLLSLVISILSDPVYSDTKEDLALRYYDYLFYEYQVVKGVSDTIVSGPLVSSFYSKDGHRMIIISATTSSDKSFFVLMSVNELNMGYLAWKQRGYSLSPERDIAEFMVNDGNEFDFDSW